MHKKIIFNIVKNYLQNKTFLNFEESERSKRILSALTNKPNFFHQTMGKRDDLGKAADYF